MANPYKKAEQRPKVAPGSRPTAPVVEQPVAPVVQQPVEPKVEVKQEVVVPEVVHTVEPKKEEIVAPVEQPVAPKIEEKQEVVAPVKEETPVEPAKEVEIIETKTKNLFAGLVDEKPRGKTTGFYLDEEVIAALDKIAKKNKTNKSKVLNTLLRNLLIDNK